MLGESLRTGAPLSILVADIDHFKNVNDSYGHDAGDAVLKEFSKRFQQCTRGIDLACRLGGEEFLIIMPDTDSSHAYQIGERIRDCVATQAFDVNPGQKIHLTASVGLATLQGSNDTPDTMFKRADDALYAAKRRGRNQVAVDAA